MWEAQLSTHESTLKTAKNLEALSQLDDEIAAIMKATHPTDVNKKVKWLNYTAIGGFVLGVVFLCFFVGINLLAESGE